MNNVSLIGRMTKEPTLNYAGGSGKAVTKFTVAVNRAYKKGEADFINCIAFGKAGEVIAQYMTKGNQIALIGRIQTGSYDAKDGTKRYTTDIIVENFEFLGGNQQKASSEVANNSAEFEELGAPVFGEDMPF